MFKHLLLFFHHKWPPLQSYFLLQVASCLKSTLTFFILSTIFGCLWDGWDDQSSSIFSPLSFSSYWPPIINTILEGFHSQSSFQKLLETSSSIFHTSFLFGKPLTGEEGNPHGSLPGTPHQGRRGDKQGGHSQWGGGWQSSLPELQGGPFWLVMGPQRLWWVTPLHQGTVAPPHGLSNIYFQFLSSANFS